MKRHTDDTDSISEKYAFGKENRKRVFFYEPKGKVTFLTSARLVPQSFFRLKQCE